jgi:hypothetical protein
VPLRLQHKEKTLNDKKKSSQELKAAFRTQEECAALAFAYFCFISHNCGQSGILNNTPRAYGTIHRLLDFIALTSLLASFLFH